MYTPTKEELEEMEFEESICYYSLAIPGGNIYYSNHVPGVRDESFSIYFYGTQMLPRKIYPSSREDIETLIRLFTPNQK